MREHGIDRAALVQPGGSSMQDFYAKSAESGQGRFVWISVVDSEGADAVEQLSHWVIGQGAVGLRVTLRFGGEFMDAPHFERLWAQASKLGISVSVLGAGPHLARLRTLANRFPTAPLVIEHGGLPFSSTGPAPLSAEETAALLALSHLPNVFVEVTSRNLGGPGDDERLHRFLAHFDPRRLMWGSNYPASEGTYGELVQLGLTALASVPVEDREWLLGRTALSLWPALGAPVDGA